jgi:hypothetical protein
MADAIIGILKLVGMTGGAYLGFRYGDQVTNYCKEQFPVFGNYYSQYVTEQLKETKVTEKQFSRGTGMFVGLLGGYYVYPLVLPCAALKALHDVSVKNGKK